jgi:hypothetical protein
MRCKRSSAYSVLHGIIADSKAFIDIIIAKDAIAACSADLAGWEIKKLAWEVRNAELNILIKLAGENND